MSDLDTAPAPSAAADTTHNPEGDLLQLVTFVIGDEEYAVPILAVQEINRMLQITRVPQSPPYVEGVINLRGKIIPVINLRGRFGMSALEDNADTRIIVVEVSDRVIGFTVDRVNEVLRIDADIVDNAPQMASGVDSEYIQGVGKLEDRLLILLSLDKLFSAEQLDEAESIAQAAA
ncbi:MAG: chemotaxis protein CheW [Planctomycetota bacterium]